MHADSLLWGRDLRERHSRGHVDIPRLLDGGVDLQVFSVVTKVAGFDHVGLRSDFDSNIAAPFDTTGLPMLTEYLLAAGLSEEDIGKVLGGAGCSPRTCRNNEWV